LGHLLTLEPVNFVLDDLRLELRRGGERIAVQPKVIRLLVHLARERDRTVSSEELLRVVWPDEKVTVASVKRAIRGARLALGDDGDAQSSIRTVRGCGYQLVLPIEFQSSAEGPAPQRSPRAASRMLSSDLNRMHISEDAAEDILRVLTLFGMMRDVLDDQKRPALAVSALSAEKTRKLLELAHHPAAATVSNWFAGPLKGEPSLQFLTIPPESAKDRCVTIDAGAPPIRLRPRSVRGGRARARR
jgi:DNA-binding winged helix-turn-helix (wHTH) protein